MINYLIKITPDCSVLMGYQFNFPKQELLNDVKTRVFLNEKFMTNKLNREMIENIKRFYAFLGPLDLSVSLYNPIFQHMKSSINLSIVNTKDRKYKQER